MLSIKDSEGPTTYRVMIPCAGKEQPIGIETYPDETTAQQSADRIAAVIAKA